MSAEPSSAATVEAIRIDILPLLIKSICVAVSKARLSTNIDIVKPIPPRQATAKSILQLAPAGRSAIPNLMAI